MSEVDNSDDSDDSSNEEPPASYGHLSSVAGIHKTWKWTKRHIRDTFDLLETHNGQKDGDMTGTFKGLPFTSYLGHLEDVGFKCEICKTEVFPFRDPRVTNGAPQAVGWWNSVWHLQYKFGSSGR